MFKLTEAADLEKAGHSLGQYFVKQIDDLTKTHAHHAALAAHHDAMKAAHTEYAAHHKATHDGMADDHEMKGHMAKGHTHHTQMAAHHEAVSKAHGSHAETLKSQIDAMKSVASEWGATVKTEGAKLDVSALAKGEGIDAKITALSEMLMVKAFEALNNSPQIAERVQAIVLEQVEKAVGGKLAPTNVTAINPAPQLTAVPRTGHPVTASAAKTAVASVPLEFQKLVAVDNDGE